MTTKAEFDAAEWETIVEGPAIAGLIVVTAQRGGSVREAIAIGKEYVEEAREHAGELIGEIAAKPARLSPKEFSSKEDLHASGLQRISQAVELLKAKATPDEIDAYGRFVLGVAERAAKADKSGGTLGIGGVEVSDSENAALDELAAALGIERGGSS
ncbi:MAG: hypothetical protein ACJ75R_05715 [Solirubrobacterales bacterium]